MPIGLIIVIVLGCLGVPGLIAICVIIAGRRQQSALEESILEESRRRWREAHEVAERDAAQGDDQDDIVFRRFD